MTDDRVSEQVVRAAAKIKQLQSDIADNEEAVRNLKRFIADNTPEGTTTQGDYKIEVYTYKKFDEAYGKRQNPELWAEHAVEKRVLDSATAKRVLTEDEYALFQKPSADKSVKVDFVD
jgi:hypothetical protein